MANHLAYTLLYMFIVAGKKYGIKAIAGLIKIELEPVHEKLDRMEERMDKIEEHIGRVENRLDKVESETSALRSGQIAIRQDIKKPDDKVEKVYEFAQKEMAMGMENRTRLESM